MTVVTRCVYRPYWNGMQYRIFGLRPSTWTHWVIQRHHEKMIDEIVKR